MKIKFQWEQMDFCCKTFRAKVFGGWIVQTRDHMIFISDINHEWEIDKDFKD